MPAAGGHEVQSPGRLTRGGQLDRCEQRAGTSRPLMV